MGDSLDSVEVLERARIRGIYLLLYFIVLLLICAMKCYHIALISEKKKRFESRNLLESNGQ